MNREGYDEYGTPHPAPDDECNCGRQRREAEEMFIEILEPFGEAEYICKRCRDLGRGMK
jgi:hypothetical protein